MKQPDNFITPVNLFVRSNRDVQDFDIIERIGKKAYNFIKKHTSFNAPKLFNIPNNNGALSKTSPNKPFLTIINLNKLNTVEVFDSYLNDINKRLVKGGLFVGCFETGILKKKKTFSSYKVPFAQIIFAFYFIYFRVFPKLPITNFLYNLISKKKNIAMSKVELLGRLYYAGFEIISEEEVGELHYFAVKKKQEPCTSNCPSYFPVIKLKRVGKSGKMITVYKLRTMHPYSEFLQEYIYNRNKLDEGGKIKDDFRISAFGTFMRKFWIDEIPMLINLLKGDIKLFGVRPISKQYYDLYSDELKQLRIKNKPGLIPPYYADLPKNIDEIMESEKKYILEFKKRPYLTDFKYLNKALFNIIIKGNRSK